VIEIRETSKFELQKIINFSFVVQQNCFSTKNKER